MKENVRITVRGEQRYNGERIVTQQKLYGTLEKTETGWLIVYDESEESGLGKTQTTLAVNDTCVILRRSGAVTNEMIFEMGKTHISDYATPQGAITVEIMARTLRAKLTERGGILEICYGISMNGTACGENRLKLQVQV